MLLYKPFEFMGADKLKVMKMLRKHHMSSAIGNEAELFQ